MKRRTYRESIDLLSTERAAWVEASAALEVAREAYLAKAAAHDIDLCTHCTKPMPEFDHSQQCDGCHLPWNWATPQGERELRAAELDARLEQLKAERAKLDV